MLALAGLALAAPLAAQPADPGELDPSAPLDPMPDLGVDWPDMDAPDPVPDAGELAPEAEEAFDDDVAARRYGVILTGLDPETSAAVAADFNQRSALEAAQDEPANAAQIERRARSDAELLTGLLQAQGYFAAEVTPDIRRNDERIAVELTAAPGPRYRFETVDFPGLAEAGGDAEALRRAFAVKPGDPVVASEVIAAGTALTVALGEQGFATAQVGEQDIVVDHQAATARLVLPVRPGPVARFGEIRITGAPPFSSRHVGRIARFKRGDLFEQSEVDDLRRALVATGLVAAVETRLVPRDAGRTVDLEVKLDPAPFRTIAGELGYGTGEGVRAEASWQHRNLFNPEGALTVRGVAGTQEQLAALAFRRNNFQRRDQVLNAQILASHVDRDAYDARTFSLSGGIERQSNFIWQKKWTWSLGGELVATDERDTIEATGQARRRTFFIAALPAGLTYDGSDDLLDPTRGFRIGGRISPELSFEGGTFGYSRLQLDASAYRPLGARIVGAGRLRFGTIFGADRDAIAPSRRFYAGGGGSVRGYGYQQLGPRDIDNDPIGGRSLAEFGLEARFRTGLLGGNLGIVPFFDGGSLTTSSLPSFKDWQFGAGLGLRYYSSFGPIRVDVGTPLNRQKGDSRVAVTVSLGQAF
ncbi:autotransporter assembly complex protein TamA [Sphingomonas mesophila]|uniref:autotransporter assembly complex protein TamA n=1 Tax=Sphingomonas mesophila TaxID=2303576 RepID=UPI003B834D70